MRSAKGFQARDTTILAQPSLKIVSDTVVDWVWDYGFLGRDDYSPSNGYFRSDVVANFIPRPGDLVDVAVDDEGKILRIERTGWNGRNLTGYERELDMGSPQKWIPALKELASAEPWDVTGKPESRILRNYFKHTYLRQRELPGHLVEVDARMAWNTGLVDVNGVDIVAEFKQRDDGNDGPQWTWTRFMTIEDQRARDWRTASRALWWDDTSDLIYDVRRGSPTVSSQHIVGERNERLPKDMLHFTPSDLARALHEATQEAVRRIAQNYKTAIPQYYRTRGGKDPGSIQLLLPLRFPGKAKPSLALAVRREGDGYYGATVLPMDAAYTYARLLTKPDTEWLNPFDSDVGASEEVHSRGHLGGTDEA
mgnify:CR=1 FL=1